MPVVSGSKTVKELGFSDLINATAGLVGMLLIIVRLSVYIVSRAK